VARLTLVSSKEAPLDIHDRYMTAIEQPDAPRLIVPGWLSDECCDLFRTMASDGLLNACEVLPPFERFTIVVDPPVPHTTTDGAVLFEHGALVDIQSDGRWLVLSRVDSTADEIRKKVRAPTGVDEVSWYISTQFDPEERVFTMVNPVEGDGAEFFATLGENWSTTVLGLCTLLLHRDVQIVTEVVPRQRRKRGEPSRATFRIVVPPKRRLSSLGRDVARGRNVRQPHWVRAHLRRDRVGEKSIRVRSHSRGGADAPPSFYKLRQLDPAELAIPLPTPANNRPPDIESKRRSWLYRFLPRR
jgi:hypothetical protein